MTSLELPGWRVLARDAGFVEGPVAVAPNEINFVSINRGQVSRAYLDGEGFEVRCTLGGGPNGAALDAAGRVWVAQNGGRVMRSVGAEVVSPGIQCVEVDGSFTSILARDDLLAPNDIAFGPDGRLWFTDPFGRLMSPSTRDAEQNLGRLWAMDCLSGELELIAQHLPHPNGLCFSADGEWLFVSDTRARSIVVLPVGRGGRREPREVARLPSGRPDGMAFDAEGALWIAATDADGLAVLSRERQWSFVPMGSSFPTNLCFAGPGLHTLVVTAARGGRVLAFSPDAPGQELFFGPGS